MTIKELIASKLRPVANAVRTKSGKTELIPVDDLEDEILAIITSEEANNLIEGLLDGSVSDFIDLRNYDITKLRDSIFLNCTSLEGVTLPPTLKSIPSNCFNGCSKLTVIELPDGLESIKEYAFTKTGLEGLILPNSVTEIGSYFIDNCSNLSVLKLSNKLKTIPAYAITNCKNLKEIEIPEGVETIQGNAFYGGGSIAATPDKLILPSTLKYFQDIRRGINATSVYYNGTVEDWLNAPSTINNDTDVPWNNVTTENIYFKNNSNEYYLVEEIDLSNSSRTTIKNGAFREMLPLKKCVLPSGLLRVSDYLFNNCNNLTEVIIPEGVETIGLSAFRSGAKLKFLEIPISVTRIEAQAFRFTRNSDITIVMKSVTPPTIYSDTFYNGMPSSNKIFVPVGSRDTYISATNWSALANYIIEPNTIVLSIPNALLNNENYTYSIDNGKTWNQFSSESITLENISVIKFNNSDVNTTILIGTTEGGSDIGTIANAELMHPTSADQTIYLTVA